MNTTKAAARAFIDANYPELAWICLDNAIAEARRQYRSHAAYWAVINGPRIERISSDDLPYEDMGGAA